MRQIYTQEHWLLFHGFQLSDRSHGGKYNSDFTVRNSSVLSNLFPFILHTNLVIWLWFSLHMSFRNLTIESVVNPANIAHSVMCLFSLIFQIIFSWLFFFFFALLPSYSVQCNNHVEPLFKNKLKYWLNNQQITLKIMCL